MTVAEPTSLNEDRSAHTEPGYAIVAFGGSAGAIESLCEILSFLPASFQIPILIVQHLARNSTSILPKVLGYKTALRVKWAEHGEHPAGGTVYVAPPNHHLTITANGLLHLASARPPVNHFRPAIDPLFKSISTVFGNRAIAVVLSGVLDDGTSGVAAVHKAGGVTMAQDESTARHFDMPCSASDVGGSQISFSPRKIAEALCAVGHP